MANPSDFFRRAEKNGKKRCMTRPQQTPSMFSNDRIPAPQPMQNAQQTPPQTIPQQPIQPVQAQQVQQVRYPVGGHATYTALMRSHDRVHTRHIPKS